MTAAASPDTARRTAQHCEELLANPAATTDVAGDFARFGTRLARALQPGMARLFDTNKLETELAGTRNCKVDDLAETLGPQMHHARFALPVHGLGIMLSVGIANVVGELDRMLGGDGEMSGERTSLPASADRFARQIEGEVLAAAVEASGRGDLTASDRGSVLGEIVPPGARAGVLIAQIAISRPALPALILTIAACEPTVAQFAGETATGAMAAPRRKLGEGPIGASALGTVEMPVTATLVDITLPLARIAALQVGACLPVSIHRAVPLTIGETTIAHGSVGAVDDRVALEIHHTAFREG